MSSAVNGRECIGELSHAPLSTVLNAKISDSDAHTATFSLF